MSTTVRGTPTHFPYTAPAVAKTFTIDAAVQVGDLMFAVWSGGAAPDSTPAGWSVIAGTATGFGGTVIWRRAQSGDAGTVVTWPSTSVAKVDIAFAALQSTDAVAPINVTAALAETTSHTAHTGPTATSTTTGKVLQIMVLKDGTTSAAHSVTSGGYTNLVDGLNGSGTNQQCATIAMSNADVAAGALGAVTWTSDQASANAEMWVIAVAPLTTTIGVTPQSDVALPAGGTIAGGTTGWQVFSDSDPATFDEFGISATPVHLIERYGSSGTPLQGPLQTFTIYVQLDGATTTTVTPTLRNGTTPINAYAPHTFTGAGEQSFTWTVSGPDQTAQVDLTNVQVDFSIVGS